MNPIAGGPGRPALRPLACAVMLAITALSTSPLLARELDNAHEVLEPGAAPPEEWRLVNGATLTVNGAQTHSIIANDTSAVTLNDATVTRQGGGMHTYALSLIGQAHANATDTSFVNGGVWVSGGSSADLINSQITVDGDAPDWGQGGGSAWGLSINNSAEHSGRPSVTLDGSSITVTNLFDPDRDAAGVGVLMAAGSLALTNGSRIDAENIGVYLRATRTQDHPLLLTLDDSHIETTRGSAIEVAVSDNVENDFHIQIADGSTLTAGNGNLLLVRAHQDQTTAGHTRVNFIVDNSKLEGDIVFDDRFMQGTVNVSLRNMARLDGRLRNVSALDIRYSSGWTLTGDSDVDQLTLGSTGTVNLGGDGTNFHTLTVGNFIGDSGLLVFNTVLEGDDALTDRLHITGSASGEANVVVNGVGGEGALTDQGIKLITIDGDSTAQFTLLGRAVGGIYEYNKLLEGADGSWYLHSWDTTTPVRPCEGDFNVPECSVTLPVEPGIEPDPERPDPERPDPERPEPEDPDKPAPVLRPETGAYLANQAAMGQLLQHSARDRMNGVAATDGVRTWASTSHAEGRMDVTGKQRLDTRQSRLQVGADMGVLNSGMSDGGNGRVGVMLTAGQADATSRSTVTGYRADAKVEGGAVGVYAHWSNAATTLDASVQVGRFSNRVAGEGLDVERYKASAVQASVEAAHRFNVGRIGGTALNLQPEAQLTYTSVRMDQFVENTGTVIDRAGANGLSTRVGVRLEGEATMAAGQFRPYVALHGIHDGRNNGITFDGVTVEGALPRSRVELSAGGQVQFGSTLSGFGGVSASQGEDGYRDMGAKVGLTYRW